MSEKMCTRCGGSGREIDALTTAAEMRNLRVDAGVSQKTTAALLGISSAMLSALEKGKKTWTWKRAEDYKRAIRTVIEERQLMVYIRARESIGHPVDEHDK